MPIVAVAHGAYRKRCPSSVSPIGSIAHAQVIPIVSVMPIVGMISIFSDTYCQVMPIVSIAHRQV